MKPNRQRRHRGSLNVILLGAVAGLWFLWGCSARLVGEPTTASGEAGGCLETHLAAVEQRQLAAGAAGRGRVQFVAQAGRGRASFDFVFHRPDSLRLQFLSPLGPVAAVLDLRGNRYLFADFRQGVFLSGQAAGEGFLRLTGLPVSPQTLISVLLAEPRPENGEVGLLRFQNQTCLPLSCELRGLHTELAVAVEFLWPGGATAYRNDRDGLLLPDRVIFHGPEAGQQTTIRFKNVRPLTETERRQDPEPIDTTGLQPALPDVTGESVLPRWLR